MSPESRPNKMRENHNSDFTLGHYSRLLRTAKKNYQFKTYEKFNENGSFLIWRHDLDLSLNRAKILAQIEQKLGICSTFFINPRSEFYNLFEKSQKSIISDIIDLGHKIGLHFAALDHQIKNKEDLNIAVEF